MANVVYTVDHQTREITEGEHHIAFVPEGEDLEKFAFKLAHVELAKRVAIERSRL